MKFAAKASKDFETAPAGNHVAICTGIVDLGIQPGSGMYPDPKHQVYLRFELPTESVTYQKDGKDVTGPMSVGRTFTASMSEKANLRKLVESWFGKKFQSDDAAADFDLKTLLGRKCLLNIQHTEKGGKTYANINAATPIPKGMSGDYPQVNASVYFSLSSSDDAVYNALPKWLKEKIDNRIVEDQKRTNPNHSVDERNPPAADFDDDIPF
jgi:hypothetical protein